MYCRPYGAQWRFVIRFFLRLTPKATDMPSLRDCLEPGPDGLGTGGLGTREAGGANIHLNANRSGQVI